MICKNCGGKLIFSDGYAICESCESKTDLAEYDHQTEVYILYKEYDEAGRRSADSIKAQDIYNKLTSANINAYCEHVENLKSYGSDAEAVKYMSMFKAKLVVIFASAVKTFTELLSANEASLEGKKLLPVFSGMSARDLPEHLKKYQALNYDALAASADLTNSVLSSLGRSYEANLEKVHNESRKKKRVITILASLISIAFVFGLASYLFFGTDLFSKTKLNDTESQYQLATGYIAEEKYADALTVLSGLSGYKDSDDLLKTVYDRYEGYFVSEDGAVNLHLNIANNRVADIQIEKVREGQIISVNGTAEFSGPEIIYNFIDSLGKTGNLKIILKNDGIDLSCAGDDEGIGKIAASYLLSSKTDKGKSRELDLTLETVLSWITSETHLSQIKSLGVDVKFTTCVGNAYVGGPQENQQIYNILNTDIFFLACTYNVVDYSKNRQYSNTYEDDPYLCAVYIPKQLANIAGDLSGKPYIKDDILFIPSNSIDTTEIDVHDYLNTNESFGFFVFDICCESKGADHLWACSANTLGTKMINTMYDYHLESYNGALHDAEMPIGKMTVSMGPSIFSNLNVRNKPSYEGDIIGKIPDGTTVDIYEKKDGWARVKYSGIEGWCTMEHLKDANQSSTEYLGDPIDALTVTTSNNSNLNIRSTPSIDGQVLGKIPNGTRVNIYKKQDGWAQVSYNGITGWCSLNYLK